jgi:acyl-CoA synthetase (AMP-forming)/AMP-acid ligase II
MAGGCSWMGARATSSSPEESISPLAVERVLGATRRVRGSGHWRPRRDAQATPIAFVAPRPGERAPDPVELRSACAASLSRLSVPRRIVFVSAIPRAPSGKPDRAGLAALLIADGVTP